MAAKTVITVILVLVLTGVLLATVNVGMSLFYKAPVYSDYCDNAAWDKAAPIAEGQEYHCMRDTLRCADGFDVVRDTVTCEFPKCEDGSKGVTCYERYDEAMGAYNQVRFYIFAGLGFVLLVAGFEI